MPTIRSHPVCRRTPFTAGRGGAALVALAALAVALPVAQAQDDEISPRTEREIAAAIVGLEEQVRLGDALLDRALDAHADSARARDDALEGLIATSRRLDAVVARGDAMTSGSLDEAARRVDAARALWQAREELARTRLEDVRRLVEQREELIGRITSLREALPSQRELLTGVWEVRWLPAGVVGEFQFEQSGALVTGQYRLAQHGSGSLQGTFVGGKLLLTRIDRQRGRDAELEGWLDADGGRIRGTWQAFELVQGGIPHGQWIARRVK